MKRRTHTILYTYYIYNREVGQGEKLASLLLGIIYLNRDEQGPHGSVKSGLIWGMRDRQAGLLGVTGGGRGIFLLLLGLRFRGGIGTGFCVTSRRVRRAAGVGLTIEYTGCTGLRR